MKYNSPVIVVDDDSEDIDVLKELINKIDASQEVISFTDAKRALTYLRETQDRPLIIFSDVNMPGMNGVEFRRVIYHEERLRIKSIPFVFYTTAIEPHFVREAYKLTVQGFFKKEASMDEIENTLRETFKYWRRSVHPNQFT